MRGQKIKKYMAKDIIFLTIWLAIYGLFTDMAIGRETITKRAVAIITFENLSAFPENDWVGAGFAESLTTKLSKLESLDLYERRQLNKVIAESGLDQQRVSDKNWEKAEQIGSTLHLKGVQSVLIGSVARQATVVQWKV